ncbi:hypothetical protein BVIET440_120046 [Burkholderia vietnamiensis]
MNIRFNLIQTICFDLKKEPYLWYPEYPLPGVSLFGCRHRLFLRYWSRVIRSRCGGGVRWHQSARRPLLSSRPDN